MLEQCIKESEIERILTMSVDNDVGNKTAIDYVRRRLIVIEKPMVVGGQFLHVRCLAHIVNLILRLGVHLTLYVMLLFIVDLLVGYYLFSYLVESAYLVISVSYHLMYFCCLLDS